MAAKVKTMTRLRAKINKDKSKDKGKGGAKGYAAYDGHQGEYGNDASWQAGAWHAVEDFATIDKNGEPMAFQEEPEEV